METMTGGVVSVSRATSTLFCVVCCSESVTDATKCSVIPSFRSFGSVTPNAAGEGDHGALVFGRVTCQLGFGENASSVRGYGDPSACWPVTARATVATVPSSSKVTPASTRLVRYAPAVEVVRTTLAGGWWAVTVQV